MGQYYHPTILKKNWKLAKQPVAMSLNTWDFDNGLKLMEHSYIGNSVMKAMEWLLAEIYAGMQLAWVGDYADGKVTHAYPEKKIDDWYKTEVGTLDIYEKAGDFMDSECRNSKYQRTKALIPKYEDIPYYKYAVNLTKKEYVIIPTFKPNKWVIHPLSLLCADGNGRGSGDYREMYDKNENLIPNDYDLVGRWAYDRIYITNDRTKIKGYKKITPHFKERF